MKINPKLQVHLGEKVSEAKNRSEIKEFSSSFNAAKVKRQICHQLDDKMVWPSSTGRLEKALVILSIAPVTCRNSNKVYLCGWDTKLHDLNLIWGQKEPKLECCTRTCSKPELFFPEISDTLVLSSIRKANQNKYNCNKSLKWEEIWLRWWSKEGPGFVCLSVSLPHLMVASIEITAVGSNGHFELAVFSPNHICEQMKGWRYEGNGENEVATDSLHRGVIRTEQKSGDTEECGSSRKKSLLAPLYSLVHSLAS